MGVCSNSGWWDSRINLLEHFLERFSLITRWNAWEDRILFLFSSCCWAVSQSQGPKSLPNCLCLSFISVVSFLLNFDSTSRSFSLVKDPVLEGSPSQLWEFTGLRMLQLHGPSHGCLHSPTNGLGAPHFPVSEHLLAMLEFSYYQVCLHLITSLCFLPQSCWHHAGLPAQGACLKPLIFWDSQG